MKYTLTLLFIVSVFSLHAQPNMVACYPFTGNANDVVGGHHGTVMNASLTTDRYGNPNQAYDFNGFNSEIILPNLITFIQNDEISVAFWAKTTMLAMNIPFTTYPDDPYDRFMISVHYDHNGTPSIFWDYGSIFSNGRSYVIPEVYDTLWNHYVFITSLSSNKMFIYENGVLINSVSYAAPVINKQKAVNIGGCIAWNGANMHWHGKIDDVRIFSRALTATEVAGMYSSPENCAATTGIENPDAFSPVVTYHPSNASVEILYSFADGYFTLFDAEGRLISDRSRLENGSNLIRLNNPASGIYFYILENGSEKIRGKISVN